MGEGQSSPHALSKATAVTTGCFAPLLPRGKNHVAGGGLFLVGSPPPSSSNWKQPQPSPTPAAARSPTEGLALSLSVPRLFSTAVNALGGSLGA